MSQEQKFLSIISGRQRGFAAATARAGLSLIEPAYAGATRLRNRLFDVGVKAQRDLGRPTISVGNITTGGTGKTPIVQWLAKSLLASGLTPAVLLRGYKSSGGVSDEAELYRQIDGLEVEADPDRVAAAARVLQRRPDVGAFLLDDGFQHRRVKRDVDIVLIDATNPFGHDHVLPRGLLREPVSGLRRANVIIITRAEHASDALVSQLRDLNTSAPILQCQLTSKRFLGRKGNPVAINAIKKVGKAIAVTGIGNPQAFFDQLTGLGIELDETIALPDHEAYESQTIERITSLLATKRILITTEKDWVKIVRRPGAEKWLVARAVLGVDFADGDIPTLKHKIAGYLSRARKNEEQALIDASPDSST